MKSWNKKILLFIAFPFLCFLAAAVLIAQVSPDFLKTAPADVIGIVAQEKINAAVSYQLDFTEDSDGLLAPEARLTVKFSGPVSSTVKILIPSEARVFAKNIRREETFQDFHAFLAPLALAAGQEKTFQFRYGLPGRRSRYFLTIMPINVKTAYTIRAHFPDYIESSKNSFQGKTGTSKTLKIPFSRTKKSLLLTKAVLLNPETLYLEFTRTLARPHSADLLNFSVRDLSKKNAEITDRIFVRRAEVSGKTITLSLAGMTRQPGEQYELRVSAVQDKNGNGISPNPSAAVFTQDF